MSHATRLHRFALAAAIVAVTLAGIAPLASAALRSPQVTFNYAPLQAYLNSIDGGINVATDQVDAPLFATGYVGNNDFTLMLKNASSASIGLYNGLDVVPAPYLLFSTTSIALYRALCHFDNTGGLTVSYMDDLGNVLGSATFSGVDRNHFGFYLNSGSGTVYSQDGRNGPNPQMLTYAGTSANYGDFFICMEPAPYSPSTSTFTGAVVILQSVAPTPTRGSSWGALKSLYR